MGAPAPRAHPRKGKDARIGDLARGRQHEQAERDLTGTVYTDPQNTVRLVGYTVNKGYAITYPFPRPANVTLRVTWATRAPLDAPHGPSETAPVLRDEGPVAVVDLTTNDIPSRGSRGFDVPTRPRLACIAG